MLTFLDAKSLVMTRSISKTPVLRAGGLLSSGRMKISCHRTMRDPKMIIANLKTRAREGGVVKGHASSSNNECFGV